MAEERSDTQLEIFSCNVAWLRKQHNLSKRKMAQILEIGVQGLSRIENGEIPPGLGIDIFFAIQDHFGIRPSQLLTQRFG